MSDLATRTAAPLVVATSRRLGVDLPKPLEAALDAADKLRRGRVENHLGSSVDADLTDALAKAVWAGRDPLADKAVQRAALAAQLMSANIGPRLEGYAAQHAADALSEHADALVETWRPVVERIDKAFARFRKLAPGADLLDKHLPTGLPTKALTPWGEAKEAAAQLDQLGKGWTALAAAASLYMGDNSTRPLIVADLALEQLDTLGNRAKPIDVASLDVSLDLASLDTYADRLARLVKARGERVAYDAAAPERVREKRRQLMGTVVIP